MIEEADSQILNQFLYSRRGKEVAPDPTRVVNAVVDWSNRHLKFNTVSAGFSPDNLLFANIFFEAFFSDKGEIITERLIHRHSKEGLNLNPHFEARIYRDQITRIVYAAPIFLPQPNGEIGILNNALTFVTYFTDAFSDTHIFQAAYQLYGGSDDNISCEAGDLNYLLYSSPFKRDSSQNDYNSGLRERELTGSEGRTIKVAINVPFRLGRAVGIEPAVFRLISEEIGAPVPMKVEAYYAQKIDIPRLVDVIIKDSKGWENLETDWPVGYNVFRTG